MFPGVWRGWLVVLESDLVLMAEILWHVFLLLARWGFWEWIAGAKESWTALREMLWLDDLRNTFNTREDSPVGGAFVHLFWPLLSRVALCLNINMKAAIIIRYTIVESNIVIAVYAFSPVLNNLAN